MECDPPETGTLSGFVDSASSWTVLTTRPLFSRALLTATGEISEAVMTTESGFSREVTTDEVYLSTGGLICEMSVLDRCAIGL